MITVAAVCVVLLAWLIGDAAMHTWYEHTAARWNDRFADQAELLASPSVAALWLKEAGFAPVQVSGVSYGCFGFPGTTVQSQQPLYGGELFGTQYVRTVWVRFPDDRRQDRGGFTRIDLQPRPWRPYLRWSVAGALLACILTVVLRALRRLHRLATGRCPACAYPVGTSRLCSECGCIVPAAAPCQRTA
jgi:hypothetical protein